MILLLKRVSILLLTTFITCETSLPYVNLTIPEECQVNVTVDCALDLLNQIKNRTAQQLPQEEVEYYLHKVMNVTSLLKDNTNYQNNLISYGNSVLDSTEKLVSTMVRKTDTIETISISLQTLEVQVIMVGKNTSVNNILSLNTSTASMDIELTGMSKNNSAAVAFMSYTDMATILKRDYFNTFTYINKTMMSAVVSATLPQASDSNFTTVNFTFTHLHELEPEGLLSCVTWKETEWHEDGCSITETNRTRTVCTCDHLGTFTIIMQTCYPLINDFWNIFYTASFLVAMVFLVLSILTFAFLCPYTKLTKTALINLCTSLLLATLVFLHMLHLRLYICPRQILFVVLDAGLLFFSLSACMWMFIEAVLLFIYVKNLSKIRSNQGAGLNWKWSIVIGYFIPLVVTVVYVVTNNDVFKHLFCTCPTGSESDIIHFYAPFFFIAAPNTILFVIIIIMLIFNLTRLKIKNLQRSNTNDAKLIISVMVKTLAQFFILGCSQIPIMVTAFIHTDNNTMKVFLFINSQQGTFVFLVHCLLNQEVRQQYRKFLSAFCCSSNRNTATAVVQGTQGAA